MDARSQESGYFLKGREVGLDELEEGFGKEKGGGEEIFICFVSFLLFLFWWLGEIYKELKVDVSVKEGGFLTFVSWASADNPSSCWVCLGLSTGHGRFIPNFPPIPISQASLVLLKLHYETQSIHSVKVSTRES